MRLKVRKLLATLIACFLLSGAAVIGQVNAGGTGTTDENNKEVIGSVSGLGESFLDVMQSSQAEINSSEDTNFAINSQAVTATRIVGYVPSWRGTAAEIRYDHLTHLIYAFVIPNASGNGSLGAVPNANKLREMVSLAHAKGVKVLIAIGGWTDMNNPGFEQIAASESGRANFANNLLALCNEHNLDGVDIDWEYPIGHTANYALMMQKLGGQLRAHGKLLTAAVPGGDYYGQYVNRDALAAMDFLNVMAYDGDGGAGHSPYSFAVSSLNYWVGKGMPRENTVLGVPFYSRPSWLTYADLLATGASPNEDFFNGDYYNGIPTIKQKAELAKSYGGIMIWEITQDAVGPNSLLTAINDVLQDGNTEDPVQLPYNGSPFTIPGVIEAELYDKGGEGLAYHDADAGNKGGAFRSDGVDIEICSDGGYNLCWSENGEWTEYTVNVGASGRYRLDVQVAAIAPGGIFRIFFNNVDVTGEVSVPNTGGWQNWQTVSKFIELTAGQQVLKFQIVSKEFNTNKFVITSVGSPLHAVAGGPYSGVVGQGISFNGSATGGTLPYSGRWTFSDGASQNGMQVYHSFSEAGTYTATFTVNDADELQAVASSTVVIQSDDNTTACWSAWVPGAYHGQSEVSHNGVNYRALWWTNGEPGIDYVWENHGTCGSNDGGDWPISDCWPTWMPGAYNGAAEVSHNGNNYRAQWWTNGEPGVDEVWVFVSSCNTAASSAIMNYKDSVRPGVSTSNQEFYGDGQGAMRIYPNPVSDELNVLGVENAAVRYELYNIGGQKVYETDSQPVCVSGLQSGTYVLKVIAVNQVERFTIVIK